MKVFRYLFPEILRRFAKTVKRSKMLYEYIMRLLKIYGKYSRTWFFEDKNYLGRRYLVRNYYMGCAFYTYEEYGIGWDKSR